MLLLLLPQTWHGNYHFIIIYVATPASSPAWKLLDCIFPRTPIEEVVHTISIPVMKTLAQLNIILTQLTSNNTYKIILLFLLF